MALNIKPFFFDNELNFDRKLNLVFDFNLFHEILSHTHSINRRGVWSDGVIPLLKELYLTCQVRGLSLNRCGSD